MWKYPSSSARACDIATFTALTSTYRGRISLHCLFHTHITPRNPVDPSSGRGWSPARSGLIKARILVRLDYWDCHHSMQAGIISAFCQTCQICLSISGKYTSDRDAWHINSAPGSPRAKDYGQIQQYPLSDSSRGELPQSAFAYFVLPCPATSPRTKQPGNPNVDQIKESISIGKIRRHCWWGCLNFLLKAALVRIWGTVRISWVYVWRSGNSTVTSMALRGWIPSNTNMVHGGLSPDKANSNVRTIKTNHWGI